MHEGTNWEAESPQDADNAARHRRYALEAESGEIQAIIDEHQKWLKHYYAGSKAEKIRLIIRQYHDVAAGQLAHTKDFRDQMVLQLQAMKIVADMVGNGGTHAEKDARLRGLIEVIGGAIQTLMRTRFDIADTHPFWGEEDLFRSDYPTRNLMRRIHELEAEVKRLGGGRDTIDVETEDRPF